MTDLFKKAVSWAYHSEDEDAIRYELGYKGDLDDVYAVVELLNKANLDYDEVHDWSIQGDENENDKDNEKPNIHLVK